MWDAATQNTEIKYGYLGNRYRLTPLLGESVLMKLSYDRPKRLHGMGAVLDERWLGVTDTLKWRIYNTNWLSSTLPGGCGWSCDEDRVWIP